MPVPKGTRIGGKPKGYKAPHTIAKELERERLRQMVCAELEPMTKAQIEHAKGVKYMILRHKDGTFTRATDVKQIDAACASGGSAFDIFTQAPNPQAYKDLMDRALDKAAEPEQTINLKGSVNIVDILRRRHARRAKPDA